MVFGRRKRQVSEGSDEGVDGFVDDLTEEERAAEDAELERELDEAERVPSRPEGPWDVEDAPEAERLDLGALQVVVHPGVEVRLELSPEQQVVAATFVHGDSTAQLNVFAAPRTQGIWAEVCAEIADVISSGGGQAQEVEGVLGRELRANVPNEVPGQGTVLTPARFVGVDGPRWFLRALLTGPAATDDTAAAPLLAMVRDVVVVRGEEAMPAREPLTLTLPPEAAPQVPEPETTEPAAPTLQLPRRGPEITEVR